MLCIAYEFSNLPAQLEIFQSNNNTLTICIIIVQDSLNINNSPYFLCKAMFDDSCDKIFSFPLKTVYDIYRPAIVFKGIFIFHSSMIRMCVDFI